MGSESGFNLWGTRGALIHAKMNAKLFLSTLLVLAIACLGGWVGAARPAGGAAQIAADLDRDGRSERVVLAPGRERTLSVWRGGRRLWEGVPRRWQPWKLRIADVDGDGRPEIAVGLRKATRFFPRPHACLFLYDFDGKTVAPKWLGSSLSKPFTDFAFADLDGSGAAKLIAIETLADGRRCVVIYSWNGFGFTAERQRGAWKTARLREDGCGRIVVEADARRMIVTRGRP